MHTAPASATDVVVARQPIFDGRQRVFAYELLFRSSQDNFFAQTNPDVATSHVLSNGMVVGLGKLTDHKPAFVNFSRKALVENFALVLSPSDIVIEVLETVEPDKEVIDSCRRLKAAGYRLALDDFVDGPDYAPLIELSDFIKVDVLATST
jgi:c-di-GMP-related signal transduction protein